MTDPTQETAADHLPSFDPDRSCAKCGHDVIMTFYEANTSHHDCPIGKAMETSYGPEHFSRHCQRCRYKWEERCL